MNLKDYYGILDLESSATLPEIKKAYRRLALQLHPDRAPGDPYAAARFADVKEAYEVLTNPARKEYYLQQRWYQQSTGKRKTQAIITPVSLLKQSLELERHVATLDIFRLDKPGLQQYILELFPDDTVEKLRGFREPETIREIIALVLRSVSPLPPDFRNPIIMQLQKLAEGDPDSLHKIEVFETSSRKKHRREKYGTLLIILITVILTLLIWLTGR